MDVLIKNLKTKGYPRAKIFYHTTDGGMESSKFFLSSVSTKEQSQVTVNEYHNDYKISIGDKIATPIGFSGAIIDTEGTPWEDEFIDNYKNYWKASQCMRENTYITISYKNISIDGYMVDLTIMSGETGISQFSFTIIPKRKPTSAIIEDMSISKPTITIVDREDSKSTILMSDVSITAGSLPPMDIYNSFALTGMVKYFKERYQNTGKYGGLTTFGSRPDKYEVSIIVSDTMETINVDDIEYTWKELFRKAYEEKWDIANMSQDRRISMYYKNRSVSGYIVRMTDNSKKEQSWSDITLSILVVDDIAG